MNKKRDIFVIGYPKAGTTWLTRLLGDVTSSQTGGIPRAVSNKAIATEGEDRQGDYFIGHGHPIPVNRGQPSHLYLNIEMLTNEKIILAIRDPRDVAVAAMHHWNLPSIEHTLNAMNDGVFPLSHGGGFNEFYKEWSIAGYEPVVRFEDLLFDTTKKTRHILNTLDFDYTGINVRAAIDRQSFAKRKQWTYVHGESLNYGKEYQLNFLRKGIVGDHKRVFTTENHQMARRYFGEIMFQWGYLF